MRSLKPIHENVNNLEKRFKINGYVIHHYSLGKNIKATKLIDTAPNNVDIMDTDVFTKQNAMVSIVVHGVLPWI